MEQKQKRIHSESFFDPILRANPLFAMVLGMCPALAVTKSVESAIGMGILFTFVVLCSNVLVSCLRKVIPDEVRTPCYIVIIATFVTLVKLLCNAFLPALYKSLGVFLSLLVVNCIVLGRAEAFASKNTVGDSALDALGNGLGYTIAIVVIALFREVLGTGTLTIGATFTFLPKVVLPIFGGYPGTDFTMAIPLLQDSAGGFIVLAIVLGVLAAINNKKKAKEAAAKRAAAKAAAAAKTVQAAPAAGGNK